MAKLKTQTTDASVTAFLGKIEDTTKREDCIAIASLIEGVTKIKPAMYGSSIVGFGSYHYKYASGHEGDAPLVAFSPRKANITLYVMCEGAQMQDLFETLGPHKTGKGCLYIKRLADVDRTVLEQVIERAFTYMKKKYPSA